MSVEDVLKLIDSIPHYVIYFYPGYLVQYLYFFFRGYTVKESKGVIVKSVCISYLLTLVSEKACDIMYVHGNYGLHIITIIIATLVAYISYSVVESDLFTSILKHFNIMTTNSLDEINTLIKGERYPYVRVYIKSDPILYEGYLSEFDIEGLNCNKFIILAQYSEYLISNDCKEVIIEQKNFYSKQEEKVLIYVDDIKRIEKCLRKRIVESRKRVKEHS
ncbi:hypothetical protein [Anaerosporobacter sp.]